MRALQNSIIYQSPFCDLPSTQRNYCIVPREPAYVCANTVPWPALPNLPPLGRVATASRGTHHYSFCLHHHRLQHACTRNTIDASQWVEKTRKKDKKHRKKKHYREETSAKCAGDNNSQCLKIISSAYQRGQPIRICQKTMVWSERGKAPPSRFSLEETTARALGRIDFGWGVCVNWAVERHPPPPPTGCPFQLVGGGRRPSRVCWRCL